MEFLNKSFENPWIWLPAVLIGLVGAFLFNILWTWWQNRRHKKNDMPQNVNVLRWGLSLFETFIASQILLFLFATPDLDVIWEAKAYQLAQSQAASGDITKYCIPDRDCDEFFDLTTEVAPWPRGLTVLSTIESIGPSKNRATLIGVEIETISFDKTVPENSTYPKPQIYQFKPQNSPPVGDQAVMIVSPHNVSTEAMSCLVIWYRPDIFPGIYNGYVTAGTSAKNRCSLRIQDTYDRGLRTVRSDNSLDLRISVWLAPDSGQWTFRVRLIFETGKVKPFKYLTVGGDIVELYSPEISVVAIQNDGIKVAIGDDVGKSLQPQILDEEIFELLSTEETEYIVTSPNIIASEYLALGFPENQLYDLTAPLLIQDSHLIEPPLVMPDSDFSIQPMIPW